MEIKVIQKDLRDVSLIIAGLILIIVIRWAIIRKRYLYWLLLYNFAFGEDRKSLSWKNHILLGRLVLYYANKISGINKASKIFYEQSQFCTHL